MIHLRSHSLQIPANAACPFTPAWAYSWLNRFRFLTQGQNTRMPAFEGAAKGSQLAFSIAQQLMMARSPFCSWPLSLAALLLFYCDVDIPLRSFALNIHCMYIGVTSFGIF